MPMKSTNESGSTSASSVTAKPRRRSRYRSPWVMRFATQSGVQGPCRREGSATHRGRRATVRRRNVGAVQGCRARRSFLDAAPGVGPMLSAMAPARVRARLPRGEWLMARPQPRDGGRESRWRAVLSGLAHLRGARWAISARGTRRRLEAGRTILFGRRLPTPERAAREVEGAVRRRRRPREEGLAALTRGRQRRVDDHRPLDRHAGRRERIAPVPADHDEPEPAGRGTPAPHPYPYDACRAPR